MTDKSIKLNFSIDQQSAQQAKTIISEIVSSFEKLIGVANKLNLGGALGQQQPGQGPKQGANPQDKVIARVGGVGKGLIQGLADQRTVFQSIATGSKTALTSMSDALKRSVADQKRELESLSRSLEEAGKHYQTLNRLSSLASEGPEQMARHASARDEFAKLMEADVLKYDKAQREISKKEELISNIGGAIGPPGGPPGADDSKKKEPPPDWRMMAAAIGKAIGSGLQAAGGAYQSTKIIEQQNTAAVMQMGGRLLQGMTSGDFRDLYYMGKGKAVSGAGQMSMSDLLLKQAAGTGAAEAQIVGGLIGNVADIGLGGAMLRKGFAPGTTVTDKAQATGFIGGMIAPFAGFWRGSKDLAEGTPQAIQAQTQVAAYESAKQADIIGNAVFDQLAATARIRNAASKRLGGNWEGAWRTGTPFGLDLQESVGAAEALRNQFGLAGMHGVLSNQSMTIDRAKLFERARIEGLPGTDEALVEGEKKRLQAQGWRGTGGDSLARKGYSGGLLSATLGMETLGIDRGVAGRLIGTMSSLAGGDRETQASRAKDTYLENVMARGVARGVRDSKLDEDIASVIAETAFGPGGKSGTGGEFGRLLYSTLGPQSDVFALRNVVGGLQASDALRQQNPYFQTGGFAVAQDVLGPQASGQKMAALARASTRQLLEGSEELNVLGVSEGERREFLNQTKMLQISTAIEPGGELAQLLGSNGNDFQALFAASDIKNPKKRAAEARRRASLYASGMASTQGGSFSEWQGEALAMGELGGLTLTKSERELAKDIQPFGDKTARETIEAQQKSLLKLLEEEKKIRKDYLEQLEKVDPLLRVLEGIAKSADIYTGERLLVEVIKVVGDKRPAAPNK